MADGVWRFDQRRFTIHLIASILFVFLMENHSKIQQKFPLTVRGIVLKKQLMNE